MRTGLKNALETAAAADAFTQSPTVTKKTIIDSQVVGDLEGGTFYILVMPGPRVADVEDRAGVSLTVAAYVAVAVKTDEANKDTDFELAEGLMEEVEGWLADRDNMRPVGTATFSDFLDVPRTRAALSDQLLRNAPHLVYIVTAPQYLLD